MARIEIRLNDVRKTEWQERAADLNVTLTDFIVASIDNVPLKKRKRSKVDPRFLRQTAQIGNNLNQLARWVNSNKNKADAIKVLSVLVTIEKDLAAIRAAFEAYYAD